jgi:hypothetical protein
LKALDRLAEDAVQQQRQGNRQREEEHKLQGADDHRIGERDLELRIGEQLAEVVQANERAVGEA